MGGKSSKTKAAKQGSSGDIRYDSDNNSDGGKKGKLKKGSSVKRRLTKAFSKKSEVKQPKEDNTYAGTRQATMKRTNTTGAISPHLGLKEVNVNVSSIHSGTISVSPRKNSAAPRKTSAAAVPITRADTISSPHTYQDAEPPRKELQVYVNEEGKVVIVDGDDVIQVDSVGQQPAEEEKPVGRERAASTSSSSFIRHGHASRPVALPTNRMSKAYAFHQQIASKEIGERGAELQKILLSEKPICDTFEDNPFKKGHCRLCKHPKSVHKDPYSDIIDDLGEF